MVLVLLLVTGKGLDDRPNKSLGCCDDEDVQPISPEEEEDVVVSFIEAGLAKPRPGGGPPDDGFRDPMTPIFC